MPEVLVVEDSKWFASLLKKRIESRLNFKVTCVTTFSEATKLVDDGASDFFLTLLDLNLPDASGAEVIDYMLTKHIPSIVFTADCSDEARKSIWAKRVIDYVLKDNPQSLDYVLSLIGRVYRNRSIHILVADDSSTARKHVTRLLQVHQYNVHQAGDGYEAKEVIEKNPEICLVITDYHMPDVDGFELTRWIRSKYTKSELAVIGISARDNTSLSAHFLKQGANDFIHKPFLTEEFYCRITQNVELIEQVREIREASNKDYLTDLFNRRYLFETGKKFYANAQRGNFPLTMAMMDIDRFKLVNDTYGHEVGDRVLKHLAEILRNRFRQSDVVCRFGGEEFCILATNMAREHARRIFDEIRKAIQASPLPLGEKNLHITVSVGVCNEHLDSLEAMLEVADRLLYEAKEKGRNRVISSDTARPTRRS